MRSPGSGSVAAAMVRAKGESCDGKEEENNGDEK